MDTEWVEYDGKGMPVPASTMVKVKLREVSIRADTAKASFWDWEVMDQPDDIIAYRIIEKETK